MPSQKAWHKPVLLGLCALVGGSLAAVPAEALYRALTPPPAVAAEPPPPKIDVVFVIDVTGSMQPAIDGVRDGVGDFVGELDKSKLDWRVGVLTFGDRKFKEEPIRLDFGDGPFTKDVRACRERVAAVKLVDGGDIPESSLDALAEASRYPFRPGAKRILMLITDAPPQVPDVETSSVEATGRVLQTAGIDQLHLVAPERGPLNGRDVGPIRAIYEPLQKQAPGERFPLDVGKGSAGKDFAKVLPQVGEAIAQRTVKGVQGTAEVAEKDAWRLAAAIASWTGVVGLGIALAMSLGQGRYLNRPLLMPGLVAALTGASAGLVSGLAGQLLFQAVAAGGQETLSRVVSWALLGLLLGVGTSLGVPNLGWLRGSLGGLLGGLVGVGVFLALAGTGELPARLGGAAGLGLCVGLMIGVAEIAFRRAWLEVVYGPRETRTVTLGPEPVRVGAAPGCTVMVHGATGELRYRLANGRVTCEDLASGRTDEVRPGDRRSFGKVTLVVGAAADRSQTAPGPRDARRGAADAATMLTGMQTGFVLRFGDGRVLALVEGQPLTAADLPGQVPASGATTADVSRNPKDPAVIGLRNLTRRPWRVRMPDGGSRDVEPQKSVRLASGTRIDFGTCTAEVR